MKGSEAAPKNQYLLFLSVAALVFMVGVDLLGAGLALTPMSREFHIHLSQLQWFLTAFAMGNASFLVTSGKLVDIYGRQKMFIIGVLLFVFSSISIALTPNFYLVCIERFIQGASGGLIATVATVCISTYFPAKERAHWMAGLVGSAGLGMAVGPMIGGYLIETYSWQAIFWINAPIGALALILGLTQIKQSSPSTFRPLDYVGIAMFIFAISMLTTTLNNGYLWGWASGLTIGCTLITIAAVISFILYERWFKDPLLHLELFKVQNYIPSNLLGLTLYLGLVAWIFNFSIYYQHIRLFSPIETGLHFLPLALSLFVGAVLIRRIARCFKSTKSLLIFGTTLNFIGFAALTVLPLDNFLWIATVFVIIGLGFVIVNGNTISIGIQYMPQNLVGLGSGTSLMIRWLGGALGGAISGSILFSMPRHLLSKRLSEISPVDLSQVKGMIAGNSIDLHNIKTPLTKMMIHDSMTHSIHMCMLIVGALYLFNLIYSIFRIKKNQI